MTRLATILVASILATVACNKTSPAPSAPPQEKAAEMPIPTEVSYTSLKDIQIDGEKAKGKRARLKAMVFDFGTALTSFTPWPMKGGDSFSLEVTDEVLPLFKKIGNRDKVDLEFLVTNPAADSNNSMGRILTIKKL